MPADDRTAKMDYALGMSYDQLKENKNAIDAYSKAFDMEPDNLDAERGLAQALLNDNQLGLRSSTLKPSRPLTRKTLRPIYTSPRSNAVRAITSRRWPPSKKPRRCPRIRWSSAITRL